MSELREQAKIVRKVKNEGGWASKWATQYNNGVPDLIVTYPSTGMVVIEVKHEKNWNTNTTRTLKVSPIQIATMTKMAGAGAQCFVGLVSGGRLALFRLVGDKLAVNRAEFKAHSISLRKDSGETIEQLLLDSIGKR